MTSDDTYLYVTDSGNHSIRRIEIATGIVTTIAGSAEASGAVDGSGATARFNLPSGITSDGENLYIAEYGNSIIRKVDIDTSAVTTIAGSAENTGSIDGIGAAASFQNPQGITTDGTNLFITDSWNSTIRKIVIATGEVTTIAGSSEFRGYEDGTGSVARFYYPVGIATDGTNLYVADTSNQVIRAVDLTTSAVTTLCGSAESWGTDDGVGTESRFDGPAGILSDGTSLYVTDAGSGRIRKVELASRDVSTLAGNQPRGLTNGLGAKARFEMPMGATTDGENLFIADMGAIRRIEISTGMVSTLAGGTNLGTSDGSGSSAEFNLAHGITTDGKNVYVTDQNSSTIRKIEIATSTVTTIAGSAGITGFNDGTGADATFNRPSGITTDGTNLYVCDSQNAIIRQVSIETSAVATLAGTAGALGSVDGIGSDARFFWPSGITTDGTNLYITDNGNEVVRKVVIATGTVTTFAGRPEIGGYSDGAAINAEFFVPRGISTDGTNLYLVDTGNRIIRKIVLATGAVTTLAGKPGTPGFADGIGSTARFNYPEGITTDGSSLFVTDRDNYSIRQIR